MILPGRAGARACLYHSLFAHVAGSRAGPKDLPYRACVFQAVALQCFCKLGEGVTPTFTFYAVFAGGVTAAQSAFSFSRSPGVMRIPRQRLATSTVTA
jgi:hypothetical protein